MFNYAWIIVHSLNLRLKNFKFGCILIIYGWNLTRCGWNITRCGCNFILEHLFFYLLKKLIISGCWILFLGWLGQPFGLPRSLLFFFFFFLKNNRKPSLYLKEEENLEKFSEFWSMFLFNISIFQYLKQINKIHNGHIS